MWHGVNIAPGPSHYGFTISPTAATINYSAQTITFTATTDSPLWQISSVPAWMTYSGATLIGANTWMLEFNVAQNTGDTRSGSITIAYQSDSAGGTATLQVGVEQEVIPPIPIPSDEIWYTNTGGTVEAPYRTGVTIFGANIISNTYTDEGVIKFDNSVTKIGDYAFYDSYKMTSFVMPNSVTEIGSYAFRGDRQLSAITLSNSVTSIGKAAFLLCESLTSITIPNSVTSIGENAFDDCSSLLSVTLPSGITIINSNTFNSCISLSSITIPNSVTIIGDWAFAVCDSLSSITIPNSVTEIREAAFADCTSLVTINYNGTMTQWEENVVQGDYWNDNVPATVVHCTDGDVPI